MIVNLMERHARDSYDRLKNAVAGFADAPEDRDDVIVHALNRLPPKYVNTDAGQAVTNVALDGDQHRAAIDVQILEAMRKVTTRSRAEHLSGSSG
jgi:Late competence development protein ComFB